MTSTATTEVKAGRDGRVGQMRFSDGGKLPVDVVVFATGVRPRDDLARDAGLAVHERGGIIADEACRTSDDSIYAVGEVAFIADRVWGLVGPGYSMAEVVVDRLLGGEATFEGADLSTKLKLLGVDVASFGDAFAAIVRQPRGRLRRPVGRRLQEARDERRRIDAARRHARRRRLQLRLAPAHGGRRARL